MQKVKHIPAHNISDFIRIVSFTVVGEKTCVPAVLINDISVKSKLRFHNHVMQSAKLGVIATFITSHSLFAAFSSKRNNCKIFPTYMKSASG